MPTHTRRYHAASSCCCSSSSSSLPGPHGHEAGIYGSYCSSGTSSTSETTTHAIKRIKFLGRTVPIVCQNENGPCPLLALVNVLLLRGHVMLRGDPRKATSDELIAIVANHLMESNPPVRSQQA